MEDKQENTTPKTESLLNIFEGVLTDAQKYSIGAFICVFALILFFFANETYFRGKTIDRQVKYIDQIETSKQEIKKSLELSQTECSLLKDLRRIDEKMNKIEMEIKDKEIKSLKEMIVILGYLSQISDTIPDKIDPNSMSKI